MEVVAIAAVGSHRRTEIFQERLGHARFLLTCGASSLCAGCRQTLLGSTPPLVLLASPLLKGLRFVHRQPDGRLRPTIHVVAMPRIAQATQDVREQVARIAQSLL